VDADGLNREAFEIVYAALSRTLAGQGVAVPMDWPRLLVAELVAPAGATGTTEGVERFVAVLLRFLIELGVDPASLAGELWESVSALAQEDGRSAVEVVARILAAARSAGGTGWTSPRRTMFDAAGRPVWDGSVEVTSRAPEPEEAAAIEDEAVPAEPPLPLPQIEDDEWADSAIFSEVEGGLGAEPWAAATDPIEPVDVHEGLREELENAAVEDEVASLLFSIAEERAAAAAEALPAQALPAEALPPPASAAAEPEVAPSAPSAPKPRESSYQKLNRMRYTGPPIEEDFDEGEQGLGEGSVGEPETAKPEWAAELEEPQGRHIDLDEEEPWRELDWSKAVGGEAPRAAASAPPAASAPAPPPSPATRAFPDEVRRTLFSAPMAMPAAQAAPKSAGGWLSRLFSGKKGRGFGFVELSADDKLVGLEIHARPKEVGSLDPASPIKQKLESTTAVRVFYATDRLQIPVLGGEVRYDRHRSLRGTLHLGECEVSIPKRHKTGRVESPSLLRFEFRPDPKKHIVLTKTRTLEEGRFLAEVRGAVVRSPGREAFVFIHGYNVSFADAARRTGQMAFDLDFVGAPIFYSWPSNGKVADYLKDETNVAWSAPHLERFLTLLAAESGAQRIHLIAHSMGNRAACEALKSLSMDPLSKLRFSHLILAAPDIDAETFAELAVMLRRVSGKITLYESSRDKAIMASKKIHGNARAGEPLLVIEGLDTIDASAIDTDFLAHSYFSDSWPLLADIHSILSKDMGPGERFGLRKIEVEAGSYFAFRE